MMPGVPGMIRARVARRIAGLCGVLVLWLGMAVGHAEPAPPPAASESEVVRFDLQGKHSWEKLEIPDLDVQTVAERGRFLPLFRLLRALHIEHKSDELVSFQPEGGEPVTLLVAQQMLTIGAKTTKVPIISATSLTTGEHDLYLPADVIGQMLHITVSWDEHGYAYLARTDIKLNMWKSGEGKSLLSIKTVEAPANLPELLPPTQPNGAGINFLQVRMRPLSNLVGDGTGGNGVTFDTLEQTCWGQLHGGEFKVTLQEPSLMSIGNSTPGTSRPPLSLAWADWDVKRKNAQYTLGDSYLGLNDLIMPYIKTAGVRVNGLRGVSEQDGEQSDLGLHSTYGRSQSFSGTAPIGSVARLFINNQLIDSDEIQTGGPDTAPGIGTWRFPDVELPAGSLNELRITVTEPNGHETQAVRDILGTTAILPRGATSYLGAMGSNRETLGLGSARGLVSGGRLQYGVSDHCTLGVSSAVQQDFIEPSTFTDPYATTQRAYPHRSMHGGVDLSWQPATPLLISCNAASSYIFSQAGEKALGDMAAMVRGDLFPGRDINLHGQVFRFGPEYYNGESIHPSDRQGITADGNWQMLPKWTLRLAGGRVADNVSNLLPQTDTISFASMRLETTAFPRANLAFETDRLSPAQNGASAWLYTFELTTTLFRDLALVSALSTGDALSPSGNPDFFTGLNVPALNLFQTARSEFTLNKPLRGGHAVFLSYWTDPQRQRVSIGQSFHATQNKSWLDQLQLRTEVGHDFLTRTPFFTTTAEWVPASGEHRLGLQARSEHSDHAVMLYSEISDLFSLMGGKARRVNNLNANPEGNSVQGYVFLDQNASGRRDAGEPGIEGVTVVGDDGSHAVSDATGFYLLPVSKHTRKERVSLDIDSVPAIYTPTQGTQVALFDAPGVSQVNLGLAPVCTISGEVVLNDTKTAEQRKMAGVRVFLTRKGADKVIAESITAQDGTYYLGDLIPGKYLLHIDKQTLPENCSCRQAEQLVEIKAAKSMVEMKMTPIEVEPGSRTADAPPSTTCSHS